eukprot:FR735663.1.p1 GENE.FR735663.1~~FR735663.1.p1  ORF type:complete len:131 (-),score=12.27 FR735663.1:28-420(-)
MVGKSWASTPFPNLVQPSPGVLVYLIQPSIMVDARPPQPFDHQRASTPFPNLVMATSIQPSIMVDARPPRPVGHQRASTPFPNLVMATSIQPSIRPTTVKMPPRMAHTEVRNSRKLRLVSSNTADTGDTS